MHFSNFLKNFLQIFENSPAPGTPHEADPLKCPHPRTEILATPLVAEFCYDEISLRIFLLANEGSLMYRKMRKQKKITGKLSKPSKGLN